MTKWVYLFNEVKEAEKVAGGSWDAVKGSGGRQRFGVVGYDTRRCASSAVFYGDN